MFIHLLLLAWPSWWHAHSLELTCFISSALQTKLDILRQANLINTSEKLLWLAHSCPKYHAFPYTFVLFFVFQARVSWTAFGTAEVGTVPTSAVSCHLKTVSPLLGCFRFIRNHNRNIHPHINGTLFHISIVICSWTVHERSWIVREQSFVNRVTVIMSFVNHQVNKHCSWTVHELIDEQEALANDISWSLEVKLSVRPTSCRNFVRARSENHNAVFQIGSSGYSFWDTKIVC